MLYHANMLIAEFTGSRLAKTDAVICIWKWVDCWKHSSQLGKADSHLCLIEKSIAIWLELLIQEEILTNARHEIINPYIRNLEKISKLMSWVIWQVFAAIFVDFPFGILNVWTMFTHFYDLHTFYKMYMIMCEQQCTGASAHMQMWEDSWSAGLPWPFSSNRICVHCVYNASWETRSSPISLCHVT